MNPFIRAIHILTVVALTACAGQSRQEGPAPTDSAVVQVENQGFDDMVIYAVNGSQRVRLGLANGSSTRSFNIPSYLVGGAGSIRFLADPVGGSRAPVSEELSVQPGDVVTLTIPPQ